MRASSDIPGVEARAWFSPSQECYYVQRWRPDADGGQVAIWISREGSPSRLPGSVTLPEDAFEIGANPTEWAYLRACEALHNHAERAVAAEGRIERMRQHVMRTLSAPNLPLESLIDLLMARAGGKPLAEPARADPPPRATFDSALARLTAIAGDRADMSSTWATVQGALTAAAAAKNAELFGEVVELSAAVRVELTENERNPSWLTSS